VSDWGAQQFFGRAMMGIIITPRARPRDCGKGLDRHDRERVDEDADNGRHPGEVRRRRAIEEPNIVPLYSATIPPDSDGDREQGADPTDHERPDNRVAHPAAGLADRLRQLRKKSMLIEPCLRRTYVRIIATGTSAVRTARTHKPVMT
jgi:hypothetical protein